MTAVTGINFHSFIVSLFLFHDRNQTFFWNRSVPNTQRILIDSLHFFSSAGNFSFLIPSITSFFHLIQSEPVPRYLFSTSPLPVLWLVHCLPLLVLSLQYLEKKIKPSLTSVFLSPVKVFLLPVLFPITTQVLAPSQFFWLNYAFLT